MEIPESPSILDASPSGLREMAGIRAIGTARRGVEGGGAPRLGLSAQESRLEVGWRDSTWAAAVILGRQDERIRVAGDSIDARWTSPRGTSEEVRIRIGRAARLEGRVWQDRHGREVSVEGRIPVGSAAAVGGRASMRDAAGRLAVSLTGVDPLEIAWSARTGAVGAGLELRRFLGSEARLDLETQTMRPLESADTLLVEARGNGGSWNLEWAWGPPATRFRPYFAWRHQSGSISTRGLVGADARVFHRQEWRSQADRCQLGFGSALGRVEFHSLDFSGRAPRGRYHESFLAWNALDNSPWAPLGQVLVQRRDFLDASVGLRRRGGLVAARLGLGRLSVDLAADVSWWALDAEVVRTTTAFSLATFGWDNDVDTLRAPRLRLATVQPAVDVAFDFGGWGAVRCAGAATLPIWMERLGRPAGAGATGGASEQGSRPAEGYRGLWMVSGGWSRGF